MKKRIHILGASGSGTTILAKELSKRLGCCHFDSDDYFWEKTEPPFQIKRSLDARQELMEKDLAAEESWILSGSLCGWGDRFIPHFDLVVFLWIPTEIRIERLKAREARNHGEKILEKGSMHETYRNFIEWASQYDSGDINMRSKALHYEWLKNIPSAVLRIEGDFDLETKIRKVMETL